MFNKTILQSLTVSTSILLTSALFMAPAQGQAQLSSDQIEIRDDSLDEGLYEIPEGETLIQIPQADATQVPATPTPNDVSSSDLIIIGEDSNKNIEQDTPEEIIEIPPLPVGESALLPLPPIEQTPHFIGEQTQSVLSQNQYNIAPGMQLNKETLKFGKFPVQTFVTTINPASPVQVRPVLAGKNKVGGKRTVPQLAAREKSLLMINGTFWRGSPAGNPNGTWISNGMLLSEPESQGVGPRGAIGWLKDGRVVIDRINADLRLKTPDSKSLKINGINRFWRTTPDSTSDTHDSILAFSKEIGTKVVLANTTKPLATTSSASEGELAISRPQQLHAIRLKVKGWPASGSLQAEVIGSSDGAATYTVKDNQILLTGYGEGAKSLAALKEGDIVEISTAISALDSSRNADWENVQNAISGGPVITKNGVTTDANDWVSEGFESKVHSAVRHPRTAIGVMADNSLVMVTVDGRNPKYSVGMTIKELSEYLISKGAVEAISLDGGGSSQVAVGPNLINQPCCDKVLRSVGNAVGVFANPTRSKRLSGSERIATANMVAKSYYAEGKTPTVVLARADKYPDALAGGALASIVNGPVLLSAHKEVSKQTLDTLKYLGTTHVVVLGGKAALSYDVESQLKAQGLTVIRIAGKGREETASKVGDFVINQARNANHNIDNAFLVAGDEWPDALIASGAAGVLHDPLFLTHPQKLSPFTLNSLKNAGITQVTVVGTEDRLSNSVVSQLENAGINVERIGSASTYDTSIAVNNWLDTKNTKLSDIKVLATGKNFPDALTGGPLASRLRARLLLVNGLDIPAHAPSWDYLQATVTPESQYLFLGGTKAISDFQMLAVDSIR